MDELLTFLNDLGVRFERFDHKAVFTTEESSKLPPMPGADTKNLFLTDESGKQFFLVTVPHDIQVDLKALAQLIGVHHLTFASPEDLQRLLGVLPGSVTILGLIHDRENSVEVWIDETVWSADAIQCHPLVNTATLVIPQPDLSRFLLATRHEPKVEKIPTRARDR